MTTPPTVIELAMEIQRHALQQGLAIANGDHHAAAHHHREGVLAISRLVASLTPEAVAATQAAMSAGAARQAATT